jgi:prevent-host-death family protein
MSERARVSVTELRQNLRTFLRRTLAGETLELTDRGRPVALLTPLPEHADPICALGR